MTGWILSALALALGMAYLPLVSGWNAAPAVYYYFAAALAPAIWTLCKKREGGFSDTDGLMLLAFGLACIGEFTSHSFFPFYLDDEFLSAIAVFCLYIGFRALRPESMLLLLASVAGVEIIVGLGQFALALFNDQPVWGHLTGTMKNSGIYAIFLACSLPVYALGAFRWRPIAKAAMAAIILLIVADVSRTAILLALLTTAVVYWRRIKGKWWLYGLAACLSAAAVYIKYPSLLGRLFIWKICLGMFWEKPLFGWGITGLKSHYLEHQAAWFLSHPAEGRQYAYVAGELTNGINEYVMILVQFGLVGLTAFCGLLYLGVRTYRRSGGPFRKLAGLTLLLILVSSFFYYSLHVTLILMLGVGCGATLASGSVHVWRQPRISRWVIVPLSAGFLSYVFVQYEATVIWRNADRAALRHSPYAMTLFRKALPDLQHRSNYLYNYGALAYNQEEYVTSIAALEKCRSLNPRVDVLIYLGKACQRDGRLMEADSCFTQAAATVPSMFHPKYCQVRLYLQEKRLDLALPIADDMLRMQVKVPSPESNSIRSEMAQLIAAYPHR